MRPDGRDHLAKVCRRLTANVEQDRLAFLVLSGSLNPVHTQHMRALEVARVACKRRGWTVVGGFLAPSTQRYVRAKLGGVALPLDVRIRLCELATADSDWIDVWPTAELSGYRVCARIRGRLLAAAGWRKKGRSLVGLR